MYNLLIIFSLTLLGSPRDINEKGNKLYRRGKYEEALEQYKKAQVKDPKLMIVDYNIGCGQYKTKAYKEASEEFTKIISSLEKKELKEKAVYNLGNVLFKSGDLESSIEVYKQVLRLNSDDIDAKINLEFAQKMLEEREKQKQEEKDKNKDKKDQKQKDKQDKKEQKISNECAKNLLEALQQDEKSAKEKSTKKEKKARIGVVRDW